MPEIAVIIPTYNRISFLERAVNSVLDQSCAVDQIIVIDDGSTDNTKEIIKTRYPRVTYIYEKNQGV